MSASLPLFFPPSPEISVLICTLKFLTSFTYLSFSPFTSQCLLSLPLSRLLFLLLFTIFSASFSFPMRTPSPLLLFGLLLSLLSFLHSLSRRNSLQELSLAFPALWLKLSPTTFWTTSSQRARIGLLLPLHLPLYLLSRVPLLSCIPFLSPLFWRICTALILLFLFLFLFLWRLRRFSQLCTLLLFPVPLFLPLLLLLSFALILVLFARLGFAAFLCLTKSFNFSLFLALLLLLSFLALLYFDLLCFDYLIFVLTGCQLVGPLTRVLSRYPS
ncbi:hypothetical protein L873DRAFT_1296182 [Choiromyces venosus 120613-1]|uniref:Uncharacterized protein n=1 Tax=Choiromyces venosus 120613-1 TaxID=1336337 RepID=A0A3N4JFF7_9PEZI|nr:hypothetical protein L873DRAFT_1296182 [Choiromyces venosus 120613-1]